MARVESDYDITGTYGKLVIYKVGNRLYARTRSHLDGKRFWRDPAFASSRIKAKQFGEASQLAKTIYASLPKEIKHKGLFGRLTGMVQKGLQAEKSIDQIVRELKEQLGMTSSIVSIKKTKEAITIKQPLSHWLVTADGRLQPPFISDLLQDRIIHSKLMHSLPDG